MQVIFKFVRRSYIKLCKTCETTRSICVLGIETSCDDTGIAIVNSDRKVLANVVYSQQYIHSRYGGITPPRAQDLHRQQISNAFQHCMTEAGIVPHKIDAIAVTNKPGLPLSLIVGVRFAKYLARTYSKPLVTIHHMEAHALQARMEHTIPYPFLCLLISGGHCQLTYIKAPNEFSLLGESLDDAPGEAFDKIARRLRLYVIPKYRNFSGGQAVEDAARSATNPEIFEFPLPLTNKRNCNFSFAGIKNNSFRLIKAAEEIQCTAPDNIINNYNNFCAGLLKACSRHLMNRTQRAIEYCISKNFFQNSVPRLVVSGGVANNDYIFDDLKYLTEQYSCQIFRPSKKFCSDNGVMIAWNGVEQILANRHCLNWDYDEIDIIGKAPLGCRLIHEVERANIKCKWVQQRK
ncbi:probable tRNA N6-adenosine threonylcarbamoyltransferase, mitochondrial [Teleopsis dalmanni]|uniref:probable tRNA N6-adenosine threonylcarbamoyltransferase, mitochondrial n=1 Tax=Teleopsis dalmanni TaxID=139649 RepID=UPI0018CEE62B|nr:probable tRNA N6-adenosine threonylcarbamoyltransferase, mitochondrial [Teleopsis dalmanni]